MFTEVNENDAKASVKLWGQMLARERGIATDTDTKIYKDLPDLAEALRNRSVDALGLLVEEYEYLNRETKLAPLFVTHSGGRVEEEYVLLVHRDSGIDDLGQLQGRSMAFYDNPRASLAPAWLDTLLVKAGFKPAAGHLGKTTAVGKLPNVVLPVFFRKIDACVVNRGGFETMVELNPQVGKQLRPLTTSPPLVPAVFCLRAEYAPAFKERLLAGIRELHTTAAGQQVLTVFRSERMEERPTSALQSALELLAEHRRLVPSSGRTGGPRSAFTRNSQAGVP